MKLFKGLFEILTVLVYIFIFTIFIYIGWVGWFKIIPSPRLKEDDAPLIATLINFIFLLSTFILSFITEGIIQNNIMLFMIYSWAWNIIFIIIGLILYAFIPDKN
jgi:hypothetical protein